jgi:hypothetical protein
MRTQPRGGETRQCVLGGSHPLELPSGSDFVARRPRNTAGNGKTMAESTKKIIHKIAKGRTNNGKSTRRTTGRAGARAKRPLGAQKTAQAEAQKRNKRTIPRKWPRTLLAANHPVANGGASDRPEPGDSEKNGLDRVTEELDRLLNEKSADIARSLADQISKGNGNCTKIAIALVEKMKRKLEMKKNKGRIRAMVGALHDEPEYDEPAEGKAQTDHQPGVVETIHAVAET